MIGVDEALERVLEAAAARGELPGESVSLEEAVGRVLRETILADQDMPPFTRSAMDGYALRSDDVRAAPVTLKIVDEIPAGRPPRRRVGSGEASRIMTGAALPDGADAVQMVEKTTLLAPNRVRIEEPVEPGRHVRRAGEDLGRGAELAAAGTLLDAVDVGLLAAAGRTAVDVSRRPRVTILPTGDELVPVDRAPGPSQIRETNGQTLRALVRRAGARPDLRPIVPDRIEDLVAEIGAAIRSSDLVLLSGGVSMGDYDLVGQALERLECRPTFDRVAIQPGKPLWFGTVPGKDSPLLFGLPGNPVSAVVDFLVFVRPAIRRLMGCSRPSDPIVSATLAEPVRRRPGRRGYLPAIVEPSGSAMVLRLVPSMGSADMVALSRARALAILPEDAGEIAAGVTVSALLLDEGPI